MVIPGAGSAQRLDCRVELTWPYGRGRWWDTYLLGTRSQLGAALDELAVRIGADPLTHSMATADPQVPIAYELAVSERGGLLLRFSLRPPLLELPEQLRTHAAEVRTAHRLPLRP
ncbi:MULTISPECIES: hypothetical protein [Nocardia]|uniref:hypothetical protein n=1 Tax=Nocardia TaxID=1817 RepID=UPI001300A7DE|nr:MULTISPECIES: hypothetical protein [Nocardia]